MTPKGSLLRDLRKLRDLSGEAQPVGAFDPQRARDAIAQTVRSRADALADSTAKNNALFTRLMQRRPRG